MSSGIRIHSDHFADFRNGDCRDSIGFAHRDDLDRGGRLKPSALGEHPSLGQVRTLLVPWQGRLFAVLRREEDGRFSHVRSHVVNT